MNTIVIVCSSCAQELTVPTEARGKKVTCPRCRQSFEAPAPANPADHEGGDSFAELRYLKHDVERDSPFAASLCPSCARPCLNGAEFCEKCGMSLAPHAMTDPMGAVFAEGFAARKASQTNSPVVVLGTWMWLVPMAGVGLISIIVGLLSLFDMLWNRLFDLEHVAGGLAGTGLGALFLWISWTIISRTTQSYLSGRPGENVRNDEQTEHVTMVPAAASPREILTCLACGQVIPRSESSCPACGWSYGE